MTSSESITPVPTDTSYAAKAVYGRENFFLVVGEQLAELLKDVHQNGAHFTGLSSRPEKPPLAMITIFQFLEKISDPQAVEATRTRTDWKYALHLSMNYPGLPATTLCEYRQWILHVADRQQRFQLILDRMVETELLRGTREQPIHTNTVLREVCSVTRLAKITQAMQVAVEALAIRQPEWLRENSPPHWYTRYNTLDFPPRTPQIQAERETLTKAILADISLLLERLTNKPQPELARLEEVEALHLIWHEQHNPLCQQSVMGSTNCSFCGAVLNRPEEGRSDDQKPAKFQ